ncbi:MAG TPA: HAD hydrolase-like protein [Nevskiaceae bacterium]|nr:HAD hydrolase-like protein [Nevskiaceae bacterium]
MKIFSDLDGTLIDVAPRHYGVYSELVEQFGGQALAQTVYWDLKRKKTRWSELLPLSKLSADIEPQFLAAFIEKIENPRYLRIDRLFPGALIALTAMQAASDELYIVSLRRQPERLKHQLQELGILQYFAEVLSGHSENDGYDVKIRLIQNKLQGGKGMIIGDTEADIITGKELGLTTVAVTSGLRAEQFLRALQPDHIVANVGDIKDVL